jgi:hypothetical protein
MVSLGAQPTFNWFCSTLSLTEYNIMSVALESFCWTMLLMIPSAVELSVFIYVALFVARFRKGYACDGALLSIEKDGTTLRLSHWRYHMFENSSMEKEWTIGDGRG